MNRLRIGLAGLGRLGQRYAGNLAHAVPRAELVAVCSPVDTERAWARDALGVAAIHDTYEQLLADPAVDAVFLVTPTSLHATQIGQALDAGKHVFCEKPLSLDIADCRRAAAHAAAADRRAMVGFVRRFDESYRHAFQHIEAGGIGRPFLVYSQTADLADPSGAFLAFAPTSGGIFLDCSVHDIDLARWLLGRPKSVKVYAAGTVAMYPPLEALGDVDNGIATVEFEGGRLAMFHASRTQAHGHDTHTEVTGTAGRLSIGRDPRADRVEIADAGGIRHTVPPSFYERFAPAFVAQATHFVDAVLDGTPFDLTMDDAVEATRIAVAMRESLHAGQAVTL